MSPVVDYQIQIMSRDYAFFHWTAFLDASIASFVVKWSSTLFSAKNIEWRLLKREKRRGRYKAGLRVQDCYVLRMIAGAFAVQVVTSPC
jgi:heme exporter protein D